MKHIPMKINSSRGRSFLWTLMLFPVAFSCSSEDPGNDLNPDPDPDPVATTQTDISQVDNAVENLLQTYGVPGAALAVSVNEKLVYSKGYGKASLDPEIDVEPNNEFRIASITKVFTASAVLKLVDEGQLNLTDKVFGPQGILGDNFGSAVLTEDELAITVDHLLTHEQGGWGVSSGGDPIDYAPNLSDRDDYIEYVLNNWPLTNAPGEAFSYSNFGYWLLARIIEVKSGKSYENYLKDMVSPLGISTLKTTGFREDDLGSNEVNYYGSGNDSAFIYTIASRRDGDGGLVISSPDLVRFLCAIDGSSVRPDILSTESLQLMTQRTGLSNLGRGLGVWDAQGVYFFTGSLPGNRSWMLMSNNGRIAVLLLNLRRTDIEQFDSDIQDLLLNVVKDNSIPWQTDLDQF